MKIYIAALCGVLFMGAYFAGYKISAEKCHAEFAEKNLIQTNQIQTQIIKIKETVNAKTYNTSVADIRSILRRNYTIKD